MTVTITTKVQKPIAAADPLDLLLQGRADPDDQLTIFTMIEKGIEMEAVVMLAETITTTTTLDTSAFFKNIIGMSKRSMQRKVKHPKETLNPDQSARAFRFAQILSKAREVFGSREEAERWMSEPAMGLDGHKPIDLLSNPIGYDLVNDFLTRMEYGVYQ